MNQFNTLTPQEQKVVELVSKGLSNREVGTQLSIHEKTVKFHLTKIYKKLNTTRYQLINQSTQAAPVVPTETVLPTAQA